MLAAVNLVARWRRLVDLVHSYITLLFSEMLLRLCGNLYDLLRPLIIHIYHLETLAELCNILKTEMIDDHVQNNRKLPNNDRIITKMSLVLVK